MYPYPQKHLPDIAETHDFPQYLWSNPERYGLLGHINPPTMIKSEQNKTKQNRVHISCDIQ